MMNLDLETFIPRLKRCGLHYYGDLDPLEKYKLRRDLYIEEAADNEHTLDGFVEFLATFDMFGEGNYMFAYKKNKMLGIVKLDCVMNDICINFGHMKDWSVVTSIISILLGRFPKQHQFMVTTWGSNCHPMLINALSMVKNVHTNVIASSNNRLHFVCLIRKLPTPPIFLGVLWNCVIKVFDQVHVHKQIVTVDRDGDIYVTLDPPLMYERTQYDIPFNIISRAGHLRHMRWNVLERCSQKLEKPGYIYSKPNDFYIRRKIIIGMKPTPDRHIADTREHESVKNYAKSMLQFFDAKARIIQDAWHNAINNPEYVLCRKRLHKDFESCVNYGVLS